MCAEPNVDNKNDLHNCNMLFAGLMISHGITGAFEDDDVTHVEGDVNPIRDLEIINEELRLKVGHGMA